MKKQFFISMFIMLSFSLSISGQSLTRSYTNLDYVGNNNTKQMLDLYIPSGVTTPTPLIIHIHGGAFMMGAKGDQTTFSTFFNNGYICADINYRLSGDSLWPAQLYDCKAAVRYLKANASLYHIDTNKIGIIGESAGAYLSVMLGVTGNVPELEGYHLGNTRVTSKVHAVVDLFGPTNFLLMDGFEPAGCTSANHNAANSPESKLLGCALLTCPDKVLAASPMTYLDSTDATFFVSCGTVDCTVAPNSSIVFDEALTELGLYHIFELVAGQGHGGSYWHSTTQDAKYLTFFNENLTGATSVGSNYNGNTEIPDNFILEDNYPNPFNPTTTIGYGLPKEMDVDLTVYDMLGKEVAKLVNGKMSAGYHTAIFDATGFASGNYIYAINSAGYQIAKKLTILK